MSVTTNSLIAKLTKVKRLVVPAGCASALVLAGALAFNHNLAHAAIGSAAPLNESCGLAARGARQCR